MEPRRPRQLTRLRPEVTRSGGGGGTAAKPLAGQALSSPPSVGPRVIFGEHSRSIYDVWPARTGYLKPAGEWNDQEIRAAGRRITIRLTGVLILDANLDGVKEPEVLKNHPGLLRKSGHIVLLGHQAYVEFRNVRIKELP